MKKALFTLILVSLTRVSFSQTKEEILTKIAQNERKAVELVDKQLQAYNMRDLEEFLSVFSDSIEVYTFPDRLKYKGKEQMRNSYKGMFEKLINLNCLITNRVVYGNTVIDSEEVSDIIPGGILKAVVIYTIENNKIQKVHFVSQF